MKRFDSAAETLAHPRRQAIYEYIQQNPGASFREVARRTGVAAGTARYHLTVLGRNGLVVERPHNATTRFFDANADFGHWVGVVLLREAPLGSLHAWLKAHPLSPQKDVLEAMEGLGWRRSTTQHRLRRLASGNLLAIRLQGRFKLYSATGEAPQILARSRAVEASQRVVEAAYPAQSSAAT